MDILMQDIRYSLRMLMKRPGFTVAAILALALGIGANTAIFSIINGVLLRPLPYDEPDRLIYMTEVNPRQDFDRYSVSYANYLEWRRQSRSFEDMMAWSYSGLALTGRDEPTRLTGAYVTDNFFQMLRTMPTSGRGFLPEDDQPGAARTVVISDVFRQKHFENDVEVLGQDIILNGKTYTIIGIMPPGFNFVNERVELWMPAAALLADQPRLMNRAVHVFRVVGRLKADVTLAQATTEMQTIMTRIDQQYPEEDPGHSIVALSLHEQLVGDVKPALYLLLGAVAFVLLIACANVANLLLARAASRQKEMAIRAALGAGKGRAIRQMLTESVMLSLLGGMASVLIALWSVDLLSSRLADVVPRAAEIRVDGVVLGFALLISLATGLVFGLFPALQIAKPALNQTLKDRTATAGERHRMRHGLIIAEVALSLVLLIGAGLLVRSFQQVLQEDPGFRAEQLLTMTVSLPSIEYPDDPTVVDFYQRIPERLEALPGVQTVSAVNALPISGGDSNGMLTIEKRPFPKAEEPTASYRRILPNYFRAIGIPLLQGREFDARDNGVDKKTVIINEAMARRYFGDESPIGQRIKIGPPEYEPWLEVVGVVGDVRNVGLDTEPALATYEPHPQRPWRTMSMAIRTDVEPLGVINTVRQALREEAPGLVISNISTMEQRIADSMAPRRLNLTLIGVFAGVALLLAIIGIYGVMSYAVTQQTQEIGIRMALGAQQTDVLRMVVGRALMLAGIGIGIGLVFSSILTRSMTDLLYKVSPFDPITFAGIAAILLIVALLAGYIPARRATKVDPMTALRYE